MKSHDLARLLLSLPDKDVATFANNHHTTDEKVRVGALNTGQILIGNFSRKKFSSNWYVTEMYHGDVPDHWSY